MTLSGLLVRPCTAVGKNLAHRPFVAVAVARRRGKQRIALRSNCTFLHGEYMHAEQVGDIGGADPAVEFGIKWSGRIGGESLKLGDTLSKFGDLILIAHVAGPD